MFKKVLLLLLCGFVSSPCFAKDYQFDWSKVTKFADVQGKKLECEKLPLMFSMVLKAKGIDPVEMFKKAVENKIFIREAMFHTDKAVGQAMKELKELDESGSKELDDLKKICASDSFLQVKKGLNLVLRALYKFGTDKEKGFFDASGNTTIKGKGFVACLSGIIGKSMDRHGLKASSKVLEVIEGLREGKAGLERAIKNLDKSWSSPQEVMRFVVEVRILTADVCQDVPSVRTLADEMKKKGEPVKSPDEFFALCDKHLEGKA